MTIVDAAPVAQDDGFATDELTAATDDLFADNGNGADSDPNGPALAITAVNGSAAHVGTQVTLASGALLTVNADGTFSYDANRAFDWVPHAASGGSNAVAVETFTYSLGGNTATVTIAIAGIDSDDIVQSSAGNDLLDGGVGTNTANYASAGAGVTVNLALAGAQDTVGAASTRWSISPT